MPTKTTKKQSVGGTYVYDKELGKVVKVSDRVPKVASKSSRRSSPTTGPCGRVCGGPCAEGN
jgi:hypothetical protein